MAVLDTSLYKESRDRYLTYALSVVSGRALPDVRDGLKPVQRRILYAMLRSLGLRPEGGYRKSAAVVGEVLAKFHPHGDIACYEAMVRMAQDFSLRYPLVDGQGNFGSLDGDNAAAYRYTEARLKPLAVDLIGEIGEETVEFRDNFDGTTQEPLVFPSRVPNLLVNGSSGIAVGMATSIPPHNLRDTIKALLELSRNPEATSAALTKIIKGPDFPTGCIVLNTKKDLDEIYRTGRGSIRMRGEWKSEELPKNKNGIIITSIPYAVNKAQLVEKIADLIIARKVPQLVDVRDESTDEVRVVLELAPNAEPEVAMAYLFKNTPLENTFPVNLTVLVPTSTGALRPELLSLRDCLQHFLTFREEVTQRKLEFERKKLLERIHILEGLAAIFDHLDEALKIVRKSEGRSDAAQKLQTRFKLSEIQAFSVVDMRVYQLSRTSIDEVMTELKDKQKRVAQIEKILKSKEKIAELVRTDLEQILEKYGDKRRSALRNEGVELEFNADAYVVQEDVYAIVTADGWIKRVRQTNELSSTRLREGDSLLHALPLSTLDHVAFLTNQGNIYTLKVIDFPPSTGFGSPVQKILKFKDEERVVECFGIKATAQASPDFITDGDELLLVSTQGTGLAVKLCGLVGMKKSGKRLFKLREGDTLAAACRFTSAPALFTKGGYGLVVTRHDVPLRDSAAVGVQLIGVKAGDVVCGAICEPADGKVVLTLSSGKEKIIDWQSIESGHRGLRGSKISGTSQIVSVRSPQEKPSITAK